MQMMAKLQVFSITENLFLSHYWLTQVKGVPVVLSLVQGDHLLRPPLSRLLPGYLVVLHADMGIWQIQIQKFRRCEKLSSFKQLQSVYSIQDE